MMAGGWLNCKPPPPLPQFQLWKETITCAFTSAMGRAEETCGLHPIRHSFLPASMSFVVPIFTSKVMSREIFQVRVFGFVPASWIPMKEPCWSHIGSKSIRCIRVPTLAAYRYHLPNNQVCSKPAQLPHALGLQTAVFQSWRALIRKIYLNKPDWRDWSCVGSELQWMHLWWSEGSSFSRLPFLSSLESRQPSVSVGPQARPPSKCGDVWSG